jgi:cation transport regulator ChaB
MTLSFGMSGWINFLIGELIMTEYPYMISNNKIHQIINALQTATKPQKFSQPFLRKMGYTSTNDRGIIPLFKKLGFLTDDGTPTVHYDHLRDKNIFKEILAARIREFYSELFSINTEIYKDNEENIRGAIARVTGGDEESVKRVYNTFKALCGIADFNQTLIDEKPIKQLDKKESYEKVLSHTQPVKNETEFHYNIQIHLPATTEISVYNAIFKSLKENLLI